MFKGASRRDRRSSKTLEADRLAEEFLEGLEGRVAGDGAAAAGPGLGSTGVNWMTSLPMLGNVMPTSSTLTARSLLVNADYLGLFIHMCRCGEEV